jgi:trehalose-phosphatase
VSEHIDPDTYDAVVFDLDGVVTDTASVHEAAWKQLFDGFLASRDEAEGEDHRTFTSEDYRREVDGKPRLDGVRSFLAGRGIEADEQTVAELGERKNDHFLDRLEQDGVQIFDSTVELVHRLHLQGVRTAVFSASRSAGPVLERAGLGSLFEVRVDGLTAAEHDLPGKPDPAVPVEATRRIDAEPARTVLVEDAEAGVEAGRRGGFGLVIGVDRAGSPEALEEHGADVVVSDLCEVSVAVTQRPLSAVPPATERWDTVSSLLEGRRVVVFLDFDGTLAPIVDDPEAAAAPPATRDALERLARECTVAIVSGRDLQDVIARVDVPGLWFAGSHGFELQGPDGEHHEQQAVDDALPALDEAEEQLRDELEGEEGVQVERKHVAIAVHTRRADDETAARAEAAVDRIGEQRRKLRVTGGRAVRELRPDIDWDKGAALRWVLDQLLDDDAGRPTVAVYAGDDLTDEDALRAVRRDGVGIVVANDEHGDRDTYAHVAVDGPDGLREVLERLAALLEGGS